MTMQNKNKASLINISINDNGSSIISARDLHKFLEIKKHFTTWWNQRKSVLIENQDFTIVPHSYQALIGNGASRLLDDYALTIKAAEKIIKGSRSDKATDIYQYLKAEEQSVQNTETENQDIQVETSVPLINISVTHSGTQVVSGRELHDFLEVKTAYKDWFPRMIEYGFLENMDFVLVAQKRATNNPKNPWIKINDHALKLDMAKEISMIQRTAKGKQARQYFIKVEKQFLSTKQVHAPQTLKEALRLALKQQEEIEILQPKAEYYDALSNVSLLTTFRDTAKLLQMGQKEFISFLLDHKYIYRDSNNKLVPYAKYNKKYFEMKERKAAEGWHGFQTFINFNGRDHFLKLLRGLLGIELLTTVEQVKHQSVGDEFQKEVVSERTIKSQKIADLSQSLFGKKVSELNPEQRRIIFDKSKDI
jgi:anti-repressor protein